MSNFTLFLVVQKEYRFKVRIEAILSPSNSENDKDKNNTASFITWVAVVIDPPASFWDPYSKITANSFEEVVKNCLLKLEKSIQDQYST